MRVFLFFGLASLVGFSVIAQIRNAPTAPTPKEKILQAKSVLKEAKKSLMKEGEYNCCIKGACDRCALDHQNCDCATDVKAGKSVCSDCFAGWQRGEGMVPDVKASQVKMTFQTHKH